MLLGVLWRTKLFAILKSPFYTRKTCLYKCHLVYIQILYAYYFTMLDIFLDEFNNNSRIKAIGSINLSRFCQSEKCMIWKCYCYPTLDRQCKYIHISQSIMEVSCSVTLIMCADFLNNQYASPAYCRVIIVINASAYYTVIVTCATLCYLTILVVSGKWQGFYNSYIVLSMIKLDVCGAWFPMKQ